MPRPAPAPAGTDWVEAVRIQYKWTVLTVTTVGVLMAGIDSRIVIVGLPQVAASIGADAEQAIWITQAYVLGNTVARLLIGRISDIADRVLFEDGLQETFLALAVISTAAIVPSMLRGRRTRTRPGAVV